MQPEQHASVPSRGESRKATSVVTAKLGGSLLARSDWPERLLTWITESHNAEQHLVLICGGGSAVDALRHESLAEDIAHWRAIEMMAKNIRTVAQQVSLAGQQAANRLCMETVEDFSRLCQRIRLPGVTFFDSARFLRVEEPQHPGIRLPVSWDVTSDSIAARLAFLLAADRLVLLKSAGPGEYHSLEELAGRGYVDRCFPQFAQEVAAVEFVNLSIAT